MRVLINAIMPHEPFNTLMRNGTAGQIIGKILEATKPEAAYFAEQDGRRTAILIVDVKSASDIPRFAEPWFLNFQANTHFRIVMTPQDLQQAGLDELGKTWG